MRALLTKALDALDSPMIQKHAELRAAIRAALVAPVAWMYDYTDPNGDFIEDLCTDNFARLATDQLAVRARVTNVRPLYYCAPPAQPAPAVPDLIPPDALFVCGQMGANVTRVRAESAAPAVPLTQFQIINLALDAQIARCLDKEPSYDIALARAIEAHHGITGDSND